MSTKHAVVLVVFLMVLVFVAQPVSAGFFGDMVNKITGMVTEDGADEPEPDSAPVPEPDSEVPEPDVSEPIAPDGSEPEEPDTVAPEGSEPEVSEPVTPEDVCAEVSKSRWCPDGETLCPMKNDDSGCSIWDCDSCPEPEDVCQPIQITQPSCPDGETLCPMKKDDSGCSVWDCSACGISEPEPRPCPTVIGWRIENGRCISDSGCDYDSSKYTYYGEEECISQLEPGTEPCPGIAITETCPGCEGSPGDCLCPMKKDEKGCSVWDCDSCPRLPIPVPPDCRKITLESGIEVIECEKDCQSIPQGAIEKCEESGGKVIERIDHKGCSFIECEYEVGEQCPSHEVLRARREACFSQGLEPMIVRMGECDTIKCRRAEPEIICAEDVEARKDIKEKCGETGGEIVKHFDDMGCPVTVCIYPRQKEECPKDVPPEAYENCEMEEGDLMLKRDSRGCIVFVDCVRRGKKEIEYEEINEMPSAARLLAIALKLESLKMDFDKLTTKVRAIADYYESTGNKAEATRFRKVAGLFSGAQDKIEDIKIKFRENANEMTEEDLRELKHDIKYISETIMQDALYIILGGEIKIEGTTQTTEGGYPDCGSDGRCWEEALRLCEPVVFKPKDGPNLIAKIHGLDNEVCIIEANGEGHSMLCKVPNYATINTDGPEILEYCDGDMVEWMRSGGKVDNVREPAPPVRVKPGRCVGRCGDGICQNTVCMADGCPCPESPESCPPDCRFAPTEFKLCTEEDERAWKDCQSEGGNPQTDPSRYGNCEIYTHCEIPHSTEAECERISDTAIRNDCYIKVADKTGDSSVCVKITETDRMDKCYVKAATTSRDESICEKIGDDDIKNHCYNSIAEGYPVTAREIIRRPEVEGEVVFTDNFEEGTGNWHFFDAEGTSAATGWGTVVIEGNTVLRGTGHNWADLEGEQFKWTNYIFKARFKIIRGGMHFNYRHNKEGDYRRYYVGVSNDGMYLTRSTPPTHVNLVDDVRIQLDDNWHTFKMVGYDNILNIYIDNELLIEYKDVGIPALPGGVAFETLGGAEFLVDDVEIQIAGKKDLMGVLS